MPELSTSRILWFAFLAAQVAFMVVGALFVPRPAQPPEAVAVITVAVMGAPSLGLLVLAPRLLGQMPVATAWLVKYACCESICLFGVALHAIGAPSAAAFGLHAVALVALFTQIPTEERFTRWEVDRLGRGQQ